MHFIAPLRATRRFLLAEPFLRQASGGLSFLSPFSLSHPSDPLSGEPSPSGKQLDFLCRRERVGVRRPPEPDGDGALLPVAPTRTTHFPIRPDRLELEPVIRAERRHVDSLKSTSAMVQRPARELVSWGADLFVMGSPSPARILQHLLGDTTLLALRHAVTPLYLHSRATRKPPQQAF